MAHTIIVRLLFYKQSFFFKGIYNGFPAFKSVKPFKFTGFFCHCTVITNYFDTFEFVSQPRKNRAVMRDLEPRQQHEIGPGGGET